MDVGLFVTAFLFGLRHGFDWDHLAAISDITIAQRAPRRALFLATLYALGHAFAVFVLGVIAIMSADLLPRGWDAAMGRFVGARSSCSAFTFSTPSSETARAFVCAAVRCC